LYNCDNKHDNLMISRRLSWASSSIECCNGEYTDVSRTISVLIIRELNTSDIGLSVPWRQEVYSLINHLTQLLARECLLKKHHTSNHVRLRIMSST